MEFNMGLFWDLIQQSQISEQSNRAQDLQSKVSYLEAELYQTRVLIHKLIVKLEEKFGEDIDEDGRIG